MADPGDGIAVAGIHPETRQRGRGPLAEQAHRRIPRRQAPYLGQVRHGQRRHRQKVLASGSQRVSAGGQDPQVRRCAQELVHQDRARVHQVLAVVQHQQQPFVRKVVCKRVQLWPGRLVLDAQDVGDCLEQQLVIGQRRQFDQPHTVRKPLMQLLQLRGYAQGQSSLTHPSDPGQRHKAGGGRQALGFGDFSPSADETGGLGRKIAFQPTRPGAGHGRSMRLPCAPDTESRMLRARLFRQGPVPADSRQRPQDASVCRTTWARRRYGGLASDDTGIEV
ncbi:hypothetical protein SAMN05661093_06542 [Kibdelosporangium aridum]|uniref:Uncharacterized protein n=1 Tax=Kibdelosporangium aridum TaxID=2030 RepID=A0A1W2FF30_KIBAR|nr:hypothetical protein [Kibdelosporangium aridum]SMD20689.1 hypothetical protein SAMN05661093_06542 [Kibdelosporangium aridum]